VFINLFQRNKAKEAQEKARKVSEAKPVWVIPLGVGTSCEKARDTCPLTCRCKS